MSQVCGFTRPGSPPSHRSTSCGITGYRADTLGRSQRLRVRARVNRNRACRSLVVGRSRRLVSPPSRGRSGEVEHGASERGRSRRAAPERPTLGQQWVRPQHPLLCSQKPRRWAQSSPAARSGCARRPAPARQIDLTIISGRCEDQVPGRGRAPRFSAAPAAAISGRVLRARAFWRPAGA